ncbi:MAG TPA: hypothetical protein VLF18_11930 [Tahibacter sp.]|uniref:hypothetical protein n=1 Tax=Tahibacter sp. TaxID=2056211 RepID=UPI002BEFBEF1|nr:hypothetical protein [Tahibacter sp.]HSX60901.1 hypothetical protein [Tahibacter sp.]
MSKLLVRAIAASFRRAGREFSSAGTTELELRELSYDDVRAIVFEQQLVVHAQMDRGDDEPESVPGIALREALLAAEREFGMARAREVFVESHHVAQVAAAGFRAAAATGVPVAHVVASLSAAAAAPLKASDLEPPLAGADADAHAVIAEQRREREAQLLPAVEPVKAPPVAEPQKPASVAAPAAKPKSARR